MIRDPLAVGFLVWYTVALTFVWAGIGLGVTAILQYGILFGALGLVSLMFVSGLDRLARRQYPRSR